MCAWLLARCVVCCQIRAKWKSGEPIPDFICTMDVHDLITTEVQQPEGTYGGGITYENLTHVPEDQPTA